MDTTSKNSLTLYTIGCLAALFVIMTNDLPERYCIAPLIGLVLTWAVIMIKYLDGDFVK